MTKQLVYNFREMSDGELRAFIRRCDKREPQMKAPYAKGRRALKERRAEAYAELERRGLPPDVSRFANRFAKPS